MSASSSASESAMRPEGPPAVRDARWQLALRIASSDIFAKSKLLPRFLLYICDLHLQGRTEEIREHLNLKTAVEVRSKWPTVSNQKGL